MSESPLMLSADVSMYPLHQDYKDKIKAFIDRIASNTQSVEIRSNNMSTRLFGEFDAVTEVLNAAMRYSMTEYGKMVFVCKFVEGDTRELKDWD